MIKYLLLENGNLKKGTGIPTALPISSTVLWVDVFSPSEEELQAIGNFFSFHPLTLEDCIKQDQRVKVESFNDYLFFVLHHLEEKDNEIVNLEFELYLSKNYLVTVHYNFHDFLIRFFESKENEVALLQKGVDFLFYRILDALVDSYFPLLDRLDDFVDEQEEKVVLAESTNILHIIFHTKQKLTHFRKETSQLRGMFESLSLYQSDFIKRNTLIFLRDVQDHVLRIYERVDSLRDLLTSLLDTYLSQVSQKTNETMKALAIITTIFMPLTFLTGFFGMNFEYLPGLHSHHGHIWFWLLALSSIIITILVFKKRKWI